MDTQDVSTDVLFKLWPWFEANKNKLIGGAVVLVVAAIIYSYVVWERGQNEIAAGDALTQIIFQNSGHANPIQEANDFLAMAAKYAGTEAAARAQLQAASVLFEAGNYAEAQAQFQKFADSHTGPEEAIANLGVAASLEAEGKLDQASAAYLKIGSPQINAAAYLQAQFSLGRIAEQSGKLAEAESYYGNAAQLGRAGGTISEEAQGRAYQIKMKLSSAAATTPSPLLK